MHELERERQVYTALMNYARLQCEPIPTHRFADQLGHGLNSPAWTIGHLTICNDYTLGILGAPTMFPEDWHHRFGPGSDPSAIGGDAPGKGELMGSLEEGYQALLNSLHLATRDLLAEPHTNVYLKENYKTKGDLICVLMTGHVGLHLGQLAVWRKLADLPRVNWPT